MHRRTLITFGSAALTAPSAFAAERLRTLFDGLGVAKWRKVQAL